jgi:hypothetical protein
VTGEDAVTGIRELLREDLPGVCRLYERVVRSGSEQPPQQLPDYFARTLLDHPWADPEIPSLVYEDAEGEIVGFLGSHARRMRLDSRSVRMACSGQLVADPRVQHRGVGALLSRRYLAGPQDLTVTDGATDHVRRMWVGLGGQPLAHAAIGWVKVIRPGATLRALLAERGDRRLRWARHIAGPLVDGLVSVAVRGRAGFAVTEPEGAGEPLTVDGLVERTRESARWLRFHVDYDAAYVEWLFQELDAVDVRGTPVRNLVRDRKGRVAGWYVYYLEAGAVAQVLQVAAPSGDVGLVLDHLLHHAATGGAIAVRGRTEPSLVGEVLSRRCILVRTEWALVHTKEQAVLAMLGSPQSLLTRLDGEWWMGHHLLWRERSGAPARAQSGAR